MTPDAKARLEALGTVLRVHELKAHMTPDGLHVANPEADGCRAGRPDAWKCGEQHPSDVLTVRARPDDGGRLWVYTSWRYPLAEADRIGDVVTAVKSLLNGRPGVSL